MKSGSSRIAVDAARPDLAHEIHAHRIAAEREERAMAERENAAKPPYEIERQRQQRVTEIFAGQGDDMRRHVERTIDGDEDVQDRARDREPDQQHEQDRDASVEAAAEETRGDHASTALPFRANSPRGRFWMKRIIITRTMILPSTAPV